MGSDLVTWLRARLDDDEQLLADASRALGALKVHLPGYGPGEPLSITRVLAEVEAKRRILDGVADDGTVRFGDWQSCSDSCPETVMDHVVRLLALPYAANPGFREEWRP